MGKGAKPTKKNGATRLSGGSIVGDVVLIAPSRVRPNDWNPNQMSTELYTSLKYGLDHDGWMLSQAMLVWGTDNRGKRRDVIIDGEHRWKAAVELGFENVPALFLDGLTEAQAKALTIKIDQRRGHFDQDQLNALVADLRRSISDELLGSELGFSKDDLARMVKVDRASSDAITSSNANVRTLPLFFNAEQHEEFVSLVSKLGLRFKTDNVTDTVMRAVREVS